MSLRLAIYTKASDMDFTSLQITIITILWLLYVSTIIGVILTVISENRNPLKASAWVVIIGFVPILGLLSYILFGQDQRRLHRIHKRVYGRLMRHPLQLGQTQHLSSQGMATRWGQLVGLLERSANSPLLAINSYRIYTEGASMYHDMFRDIASAQHHIHLEAYIFEQGELFDKLITLLKHKRQEGIDVRIIYDYLGSYSVKQSLWRELSHLGIQCYPYLPVYLALISSTVNYRNHRKVCIIDGRIGYLGGMNCADRYLRGNHLGTWRDTHLRIEGSAVSGLQSAFLLDWYTVSRRVVQSEHFFPPSTSVTSFATSSPIQIILGGPMDEHQRIEQAFIGMITRAQKRICIQTPYFLPTDALLTALSMAALAGVIVELMIPAQGDSKLTSLGTQSYLEAMMRDGVHVYRYEAGFLHSKLMIVDSEVSIIGSANMDFRSLEHNFEISGIIYDERLSGDLQAYFERDKQASSLLTLEQWQSRNKVKRLAESAMRLFAPLL